MVGWFVCLFVCVLVWLVSFLFVCLVGLFGWLVGGLVGLLDWAEWVGVCLKFRVLFG